MLLSRLQCFPQAPSLAPCRPHLCSGERRGTRGVPGQRGQMPVPRAGSVGTAPRAGQSRADKGEPKPQGKAWIRACPGVLSCSHKAP